MTEVLRAGAAVEDDDRPGRAMPSNVDAESALLGMILSGDDAALADAQEVLRPEDFYRSAHAAVFSAALTLVARGEPTDVSLVIGALTEAGALENAGGRLELLNMLEAAGVAGSGRHHARLIADLATRRRLIAVGTRVAAAGYSGEGSTADLLAMAEGELFRVAAPGRNTEAADMAEAVGAALEQAEAIHQGQGGISGLPTGLVDLDLMLWGLQPGALYLVAARPGVGKSALVGRIARNVAVTAGAGVMVVSLEMSARELGGRWLTGEARVPWAKLRAGQAADEDWAKLARAAEVLRAPVHLVAASNATPIDIRSRARRLLARGLAGLGLIVVDYLQLMRAGGKFDNRASELAEITRSLKLLAIELQVPVLACSQLNRAFAQRQDPRPQLSDLRDSGSLEQDADVVMFLHRPEDRPYVEVIVAKNRNGPVGSIPLGFSPGLTLFESWTRVGRGS